MSLAPTHELKVVLDDGSGISTNDLIALCDAMQPMTALHVVNVIWQFRSVNKDGLDQVIGLHKHCSAAHASFFVNLVVPADADGFVRGTEPSSTADNLLYVARRLRSHGIYVRWVLPVRRALLYRIEALYHLARDEEVEPILMLPGELNMQIDDAEIAPDDNLYIWDFITYRLLTVDRKLLSDRQQRYYEYLASYFLLRVRDPSAMPEGANFGTRQYALTGQRDKSHPLQQLRELAASIGDVISVVSGGVRAVWSRIFAAGDRHSMTHGKPRFSKVLLIGAYGGEHIGDAAILGGVLCRAHARYGTTDAILMTQRVDHTRHLLPMLEVPVSVTAEEYTWKNIRRYLNEVDAVLFAGGPLVDIPKQLIRHLYTSSKAGKARLPFIAEGIGPGPFTRPPSRYVAKRMIELASRINVRTADSANHEILRGLDVEVGECPAFDYLASRSGELSKLRPFEVGEIDALLSGTQGRPVVGINIRPIGHLHTIGAPDGDLEAYTRSVESRFEEQLAAGLHEYSDRSTAKPCFIYFPMNAIQFGSSDIQSAYRIRRRLGDAVDFRVWQADASLDAVIALLRRVDIAITMRFHATIFALSQNCKVIGIDYRIGKRDKVAELLDDKGQGEFCTRIDQLTAEWLSERLGRLAE